MSKKSHAQKLKRQQKLKAQRPQVTSRAVRVRRDRETFENMRQALTKMAPDTIMHVGEQLVMTDAELQAYIADVSQGALEIGLTGEGGIDDPRNDIQRMAKLTLGLQKTMTAGELLASLDAISPFGASA